MFGYIMPVMSVLSEEQKQRYRAVYCGVCHALGRRHGLKGRVSLSNDMTFLALLLSSLYEPDTGRTVSRCVVHPLRSHDYASSSMIDYAADMNALLFYWKCVDQRMDDRSLRGKAGELLFRKPSAGVRSLRPSQAAGVEKALADNNIETVMSEITMVPDTMVQLTDEDAEKVRKTIDMFDDMDDVQEVYTNADLPDDDDEE